VRVTPNSAMTFSAFWACVRIIAETVASLPLFVYRRKEEHGKERATDQPTYRILHAQPNPLMTSMVMREVLLAQTLVHGNGYAEIVRDGTGRVAELWPLPSTAITPRALDTRTLIYEVQTPQGKIIFRPEEILHIPGLGFDGISGLSVVKMARQAIGMGLAADAFGASFLGNAMRPSGVVETVPGANPNDKQISDTVKSLESLYTGKGKTGRVAMLLGGLSWKQATIPPDDAQFLETRSFQVREMGRWFRIFPYMLGEDDKAATYASVEQFGIMSVVHTYRPWMVRLEQEYNRKLFDESEQKTLFTEHLIDGLLRGDAKTRSEALQLQLQNGVINQDGWNEIENRNPLPDGLGKHYWMPLNFGTIESSIKKSEQPQGSAPKPGAPAAMPAEPDMQRMLDIFAPLFRDADGRWAAREARNATPESALKIYLPSVIALARVIHGAELTERMERRLRELCIGHFPRIELNPQLIASISKALRHEQELSDEAQS